MRNTPWGIADHEEKITDGITFYSTPSHGGFYLSPERNAQVPKCLKERSFNAQGLNGWYEEDCDANIVIATFPLLFSEKEREYAFGFVETHYNE